MTTLYEYLREKRGHAYSPEKIKRWSYLRKKPNIDKPPGALAAIELLINVVASVFRTAYTYASETNGCITMTMLHSTIPMKKARDMAFGKAANKDAASSTWGVK